METSAPLVNSIANNVLLYRSQHIDQTLPQIIHILHFCLVYLLLNDAQEFVVNCVGTVFPKDKELSEMWMCY